MPPRDLPSWPQSRWSFLPGISLVLTVCLTQEVPEPTRAKPKNVSDPGVGAGGRASQATPTASSLRREALHTGDPRLPEILTICDSTASVPARPA